MSIYEQTQWSENLHDYKPGHAILWYRLVMTTRESTRVFYTYMSAPICRLLTVIFDFTQS